MAGEVGAMTMTTSITREAPAVAYRAPARALHWITAFLVILTIPAGQIMVREGLPRSVQDPLFIFHKNVGVVILLLVIARLFYRWCHPAPPLPSSVPPLQARVAKTTHWMLYLLLIIQAVSGYVRVKAGGFPIEFLDWLGAPSLVPRSERLTDIAMTVHSWNRIILVFLIAIHVGAALLHGIVLRDGVFQRMWPRTTSAG
jgi:cytochrome b561